MDKYEFKFNFLFNYLMSNNELEIYSLRTIKI